MKRFKYIVIIVSIITLTACKKSFLDVNYNDNLYRQSYVKDLNSMEEFLKGIHVMISTGYESSYSVAYAELVADNLKLSSSSSPMAVHYNWSQLADDQSSNDPSMNLTWQEQYKIIRACNFVIEEVDKYKSENPNKAADIKGKAYAVRALVHFRLVNIFAQAYNFTPEASHPGVPYITASDITATYSRQTVAEVYNKIIADLTEGIALMPATVADCRIMSAPAAKAILARVYLFKEDYTNAKKLAIELSQQFPLMTIPQGYPNDLFKNKPPGQTEIILQATPVQMGGFLGLFLQYYFSHTASNDIGNLLREYPNDIRSTWVKDTIGQLAVTKFPGGVAGGLYFFPEGDYYSPISRSSEIFLTAAEASAKTGDEINAKAFLNAVRQRADPTLQEITPTGQALLDSIYKERRKELCFEGLRMYDLQRWKKDVQRIDVLPGHQSRLPYPNNKAISPIPGSDVRMMGLQQNIGY